MNSGPDESSSERERGGLEEPVLVHGTHVIGGGAQALSPESALLHADGVVESLGFFLQQHVPLGAGLLHLAHAAEQQQRRRVKHVHQTHAQVQLHEAQVVHDLPRDYRSQSVGERVRDVRDGKDAAVDGHVTHVHQEGQRGQQRRVHQRDAKQIPHSGSISCPGVLQAGTVQELAPMITIPSAP